MEDPRIFLKRISIDFLGDREGCSMGLSKIFCRSLEDSTGLPRRFSRSWEIVKVFLEDSASQKQTSCSWDGRINLSFSFSTWFCSFPFASPSFFPFHCRFWETGIKGLDGQFFFSSALSSCRMLPAPHYSAAPLRERDHGAQ